MRDYCYGPTYAEDDKQIRFGLLVRSDDMCCLICIRDLGTRGRILVW